MTKKGLIRFNIPDEAIFLLLLAAMVFPLLWLSFYSQPCNDDYDISADVIKNGFFHMQHNCYLHLGGRYFALFMLGLNPLVLGSFIGYKLNVFLVLTVTILSAFWLFKTAVGNTSVKVVLVVFSVFTFTYLFRLPDVTQGIFWFSGCYPCFVPSVLSLLLFGCAIKFRQTEKNGYYALMCLLCICIIGSYETYMVFTDALILLFLIMHYIRSKKVDKPFLLLFIISVGASVISFFAPGNSARAASLHNAHNLPFSIIHGLTYGYGSMFHWLIIVVLVAVIVFNSVLNGMKIQENGIFNVNPLYPLLFCVLVPFVGNVLLFWAQGIDPALRSEDSIYFYFLISFFYFVMCLANKLKGRNVAIPLPVKLAAYAVLLFLVFFKHNNLTAACGDIFTGTASKFNSEMTARTNYLLNAKQDSCAVESIKNVPTFLMFDEQPKDTADWRYKALCGYYHKRFITLKN